MSELLQSFSVVFMETVCCVIFFKIFIDSNGRNKRFTSRLLMIFCFSFLCFVGAYLLQEHESIRLILDVGLTAFILSLYFKEKLGKCLVLSVVFMGLLWTADFIAIFLYPTLLHRAGEESEIKDFFLAILAKMFLFLMILMLDHIFRHNEIKYIYEKNWLAFLNIPFFSIAIIFVFMKNIHAVKETGLKQLFAVLAFGMVCINIMMLYLIQNMSKREYLYREKALLDLETRNKLQLYETISEKVQNQREVSHEYKNQITCIQSLCEKEEYDQLKEYLKQINGDVLHDLDYIDANHVFANAVINAKYQEAVQKHILVVCRVNDLSRLTINSSDLVVLLSNLLNNAIEACEKCGKERNLKLKCVYEEGELILSIKNTYDGKLKQAGEKLYTTKEKEKESHGIGLKNVKRIIEKNGGYYAIEHTEKEFLVSVVIPQ